MLDVGAGLTTLVEALICVRCASNKLVARWGDLYCGGCHLRVVRVPFPDEGEEGRNLTTLARLTMRKIARDEVA